MNQTDLLTKLAPEGGWRTEGGSPRIEPLEWNAMGWRQKRLVKRILAAGVAFCPNLLRTMLCNYRVFSAFLSFNSKVMPKGELTRRQTELVILRVAWQTRSHYEWGQHVVIGMKAGLNVVDISRIPAGGTADGWSESESVLLLAVDDLVGEHFISSQNWEALNKHFSESLLVEFMLTVGGYTALAGALNSCGVQLEPENLEMMTDSATQGPQS